VGVDGAASLITELNFYNATKFILLFFFIRVRVCCVYIFLMGRRGVMMISSNDLHDQRERSRGARDVDLFFYSSPNDDIIRTSFSLFQQTNTLIGYLRERKTVVD
jgi:hypothetical protein